MQRGFVVGKDKPHKLVQDTTKAPPPKSLSPLLCSRSLVASYLPNKNNNHQQ